MSAIVRTDLGKPFAVVTWPAPTVSDNGAIASQVYSPAGFGPGVAFPLGVTTMNFTVTDEYDNVCCLVRICRFSLLDLFVKQAFSCQFRISVRDLEPPV